MTERRYTDDEVAAIFARATEVQLAAPRELPAAEGMSLAQLQEIGREAGIAPELVAEAARALEQPQAPRAPTFLGLPLGVAHTVELGRKLGDADWERLVVELRETFQARGKVHLEGTLRSWTNGNLHILVEPSGDGDRVRMSTVRRDSQGMMLTGLGIFGVSAVTIVAAVATGSVDALTVLSQMGSMLTVGATIFGIGALRLPRWAQRRREQMQRIGARLLRDP